MIRCSNGIKNILGENRLTVNEARDIYYRRRCTRRLDLCIVGKTKRQEIDEEIELIILCKRSSQMILTRPLNKGGRNDVYYYCT